MNKALAMGLLAGLLASSAGALESTGPQAQPGSQSGHQPKKALSHSRRPAPRAAPGMPESARKVYDLTWGVDNMTAQLAESGQLVRFSYRVTDASKAAALNDKASSPYLMDEKAHAVLQVPTMEKVGPLRQSNAAENGKSYWMVFSNKGYVVKPGHQVSVVVGRFRVDGLVVE